MPKAVKGKNAAGEAGPAKKAGGKKKIYDMPEKVPKGTVVQDLFRNQWRIGDSIGIGGFGEIYSACKVGEEKYDFVIKCEPHGNGTLFVEMHFYLRNAKLEEIKRFKKEKKLKTLGMPYMLGSGSSEINGVKHRFIVMPRYGCDLSQYLKDGGGKFPESTVYRLAIQMLDVYEYIHSAGYIHGDLKVNNILLGNTKEDIGQAYLVDFGLAVSITTKEFKPDIKRMHNGTLNYTSRDAHQGVPTRRSDFEILGYNLIEWLGGTLPWAKEGTPPPPVTVQKAKESFMADVSKNLKGLFPKGVPSVLEAFLKYLNKLEYNEVPDYDFCKKLFENALKKLNVANSGPLHFGAEPKKLPKISPAKAAAVAAATIRKRKVDSPKVVASEEIIEDDNDDDDVIFEKIPEKRITPKKLKTVPVKRTPALEDKTRESPRTRGTPGNGTKASPIEKETPTRSRLKRKSPLKPETPSPKLRRMAAGLDDDENSKNSSKADNAGTPKAAGTSSLRTRSTPLKTQINFSPSISIQPSPLATKPGTTIVNDNLTPHKKPKKTYEINLDLDISLDANVLINVNRKRKGAISAVTTQDSSVSQENISSPATRVRVRKVANENDAGGSRRSPRTPIVSVKKTRRFESPR